MQQGFSNGITLGSYKAAAQGINTPAAYVTRTTTTSEKLPHNLGVLY